MTLDIPRLSAGGCPQTASTEANYLDSLYRDVRKIIHVTALRDITIIAHLNNEYTRKELKNSCYNCTHYCTDDTTGKQYKSKNNDKSVLLY